MTLKNQFSYNLKKKGIEFLLFLSFAFILLNTVSPALAENNNLYDLIIPVGTSIYDIKTGDFDNNKIGDLILCDNGEHSIHVLAGTRSGSFIKTSYPSPVNPVAIEVEDFNNDGICDFASVNWNSLTIYCGRGDGTFYKREEKKLEKVNITKMVSGDFNNDKNLDIIIGGKDMDLRLIAGNGDGTFLNDVFYGEANNPSILKAEDLNLDKQTDLIIVDTVKEEISPLEKLPDINLYNEKKETVEIIIFMGNEMGVPDKKRTIKGGLGTIGSLATGDIDRDFYPDLILSKPDYNLVTILYGLGGGFFGKKEDMEVKLNPQGLILKNNEDLIEIITANSGNNTLSKINLSEKASLINYYRTGKEPDLVLSGDFNGDKRTDLISLSRGKGEIYIIRGLKKGSFYDGYGADTEEGPSDIAAGDFNCDGIKDLAVTNSLSNTVSILLGLGDGSFYGRETKTREHPSSIKAEDFNGDEIKDLLVVNKIYNGISLFIGDGTGEFKEKFFCKTGKRAIDAVPGDFNRDKIKDLAVIHFKSGEILIMEGKGDGTFLKKEKYNTGEGSLKISCGDFNGDKIKDLVSINNEDNSLSILIGKADGTFDEPINFPTGERPVSLLVKDWNSDGLSDLIIANSGSKDLSFFMGSKEKYILEKEKIKLEKSPLYLSEGNINNDKREDLIVTSREKAILILERDEENNFKNPYIYNTLNSPFIAIAGDFIGKEDKGRKDNIIILNKEEEDITFILNKLSWNDYEREKEKIKENAKKALILLEEGLEEEALELNPLCFEAYYRLGLKYEEKEEIEKAALIYEKALATGAISEKTELETDINAHLAYCYCILDKLAPAEDICRRIENKSHLALFTMGLVHEKKGNTKIALSLLDEYIKKSEDSFVKDVKKYKEAKERIIEIEINSMGPWASLMEIMIKSSDEKEIKEAFEKIKLYRNEKIKKELIDIYKKELKTFRSYNWLIEGLEYMLKDLIKEPWKKEGYLTIKDFSGNNSENNIYRPYITEKFKEIKTDWNDSWKGEKNILYRGPSIFYDGPEEPAKKGSLLYLSEDGGFSWEKILKSDEVIREVLSYSGEIIVATGGKWINPGEKNIPSSSGSIIKSSDRGLTWEIILKTNSAVKKILMGPKDEQIYALTDSNGIYASSDGGKNWYLCGFSPEPSIDILKSSKDLLEIESNLNYWAKNSLACEKPEIKDVYIYEDNKKEIFFALLSEKKYNLDRQFFTYNYLLISSDGGNNWETLKWPEDLCNDYDDCGDYNGIYWYRYKGRWKDIKIFAVNKKGEVYIEYKKGTGLFKSSDMGERWSLIPAIPGFNIYDIERGRENPMEITAYTEGNIYRSTDGGISWNKISRRMMQ